MRVIDTLGAVVLVLLCGAATFCELDGARGSALLILFGAVALTAIYSPVRSGTPVRPRRARAKESLRGRSYS